MPRRIDVELTSSRDDGTWTWRAAGAKQPKGVVDGNLLYEGAQVGDVVRAEADFEIDGITITHVTPPPSKKSAAPRLEIIGSGPSPDQLVTTSLVPKSDRPRRDRDDRDRGGRDRGGRGGPPRGDRPGRDRADGGRPRRDDRPAGERTGARTGAGGDRPDRGGPRRTDGRPGRPDARPGGAGGAGGGERRPRSEAPERARPKRLSAGTAHRDAVLAGLSPEQRPVAEQVLRGGIPAVRRAIEEQNAKAREVGQPEVKADALVAMAEELLPALKTADWRDRAEAAVKDVEEIGLRDLRSVVTSADAVARDEETRDLARRLKEALDRRVEKQRTDWITEINNAVAEGRLVRALRVSSRPPDPNLRLPAELATQLAEAASSGLAADTPADRWVALLEAVVASPVRRNVKPAGLPAGASPQVVQTAHQSAGRVPALAALLGIDMPPPPGPARPGGRPAQRPPRPPAPPRPAAAPAATATPPAAPAQEATAESHVDVPAEPAVDVPAEPAVDSPAPEVAAEATPSEPAAQIESPTPAEAEVSLVDDARSELAAAEAETVPDAPVAPAPVTTEVVPPATDTLESAAAEAGASAPEPSGPAQLPFEPAPAESSDPVASLTDAPSSAAADPDTAPAEDRS